MSMGTSVSLGGSGNKVGPFVLGRRVEKAKFSVQIRNAGSDGVR